MSHILVCPRCGGEITEYSKSFSCSNWKKEDGECKFSIWKSCCGAIFTIEDVEKLLGGETIKKTNISKAGKEYPALWSLHDSYEVRFEYANRDGEASC